MQERHHVKTIPGEQAPPEIVPHPVRREVNANMQMDDINIPLVAVAVAFFGVLLAVSIVSLQAWFYNRQAAEIAVKTLAQDDPRTQLGALLEQQRMELDGKQRPAPVTSAPATASTVAVQPKVVRIPIGEAMKRVSQEYAAAAAGGGAAR